MSNRHWMTGVLHDLDIARRNDNYSADAEQALNINYMQAQTNAAANNVKIKPQPAPNLLVDPRKAQLLALFDLSDKRGQDLLIAIAVIHAERYPKVPE